MKKFFGIALGVFPALAIVGLSLVAALNGDEIRSTGDNGQGEVLRWKLQPGQKFKLEFDQDMKQKFDAGGGEQESPMRYTMFMSWTIDNASENEFQITQVIDRVKLAASIPMVGDVDYDSASGEEPTGFAQTFAASFKPLIGLKIAQTMDARGKSVKCEIDPAVLEELKSAGLGSQFTSEEMLKNLIGQAACILPEDSVDNGATWDDEFVVQNQMGKMTTNAKYTYAGNETVDGKSLDKIGVTSTVAIEPQADAPFELSIGDQDNKGTIYFDNKAGYVTSATMNQSMAMKVNANGQEITIQTSGTLTFTLKPDDGTETPAPEAKQDKDSKEEGGDKR